MYLDSSDYSRLSNEITITPELRNIRSELVRLAESNLAVFAFSGAILGEMSPLRPEFSGSANARAKLLSDLCGKNALISLDKIINNEISQLRDRSLSSVPILSSDGTWFPDVSEIISPLQWADWSQILEEELKKYPRKIRRAAKRRYLEGGEIGAAMRSLLGQAAESLDLSSILQRYPMRPVDAQILVNYSVGKATKADAEAAFLESLRDPSWMMQWFANHHGKMLPIMSWLRGPSEKIMDSMRAFVDIASRKRELEEQTGTKVRVRALTKEGWEEQRKEFLENIISSKLAAMPSASTSRCRIEDIVRYCPGLSTCISAIHTSLWNSLHANGRELAESDIVDAVHAIYSPYVTHFRADGYMAPHIRKHAPSSTHVVARLQELPERIIAWTSTHSGL